MYSSAAGFVFRKQELRKSSWIQVSIVIVWVLEPQITMAANLGRKRNSLVLSFHMNNVKTTDKNTAWYNSRINQKCARQNIKPFCSVFFFPMPAPFSCFCLCFCFVPATQNCFWAISYFLKVCSYLGCGLCTCEVSSLGCLVRRGYVFIDLGILYIGPLWLFRKTSSMIPLPKALCCYNSVVSN